MPRHKVTGKFLHHKFAQPLRTDDDSSFIISIQQCARIHQVDSLIDRLCNWISEFAGNQTQYHESVHVCAIKCATMYQIMWLVVQSSDIVVWFSLQIWPFNNLTFWFMAFFNNIDCIDCLVGCCLSPNVNDNGYGHMYATMAASNP